MNLRTRELENHVVDVVSTHRLRQATVGAADLHAENPKRSSPKNMLAALFQSLPEKRNGTASPAYFPKDRFDL